MSKAKSLDEVDDMTMIEHAVFMDAYNRYGHPIMHETNALIAAFMANQYNFNTMAGHLKPNDRVKAKDMWYKLALDQSQIVKESPDQINKRLRKKMRVSE